MRRTIGLGAALLLACSGDAAPTEAESPSATGGGSRGGATDVGDELGDDDDTLGAGPDGDGDADSKGGPGGDDAAGSGGGPEGESSDGGDDSTDGDPASQGTTNVLTYNVAGLPDFISQRNPAVNTPLISPLLDAYDLVLVQEDFSYHAELAADASHPFQSTPGGGGSLGDGLNRFSHSEFVDFERTGWAACNGHFDSGSDCLTDKGYSVGLHELAPGALVDVYNLHMDAGGSQADIQARQAQVQQMLSTILTRSQGRALIVAGDTNMGGSDEADFVTLLAGAGLVDACRELDCGEQYRIDRVMFRSSADLQLTPTSWIVDPSFVDGGGYPLSDHEAIGVEFDWATR